MCVVFFLIDYLIHYYNDNSTYSRQTTIYEYGYSVYSYFKKKKIAWTNRRLQYVLVINISNGAVVPNFNLQLYENSTLADYQQTKLLRSYSYTRTPRSDYEVCRMS